MPQPTNQCCDPQRLHAIVQDLVHAQEQFAIESLDRLGQSYLLSYPAFVRYFRELPVIEERHMLVGANFTFAWMPTIPRLDASQLTAATAALNHARTGACLELAELRCLQQLLSNSLTAATKLLHFAAPQHHAIFDRRVCKSLRRWDLQFCSTKLPNYLRYLELCRALAQQPAIEPLRTALGAKLGYPITHHRAIELMLFTAPSRLPAAENGTRH